MSDHDDAAAAFAATAGPGDDGVPRDWSEISVGEALAASVIGEWVYAADSGRWHHWDGKRWRPMPPDAIHAVAQRWIVQLGQTIAGRSGDVSKELQHYAHYRKVMPLEHVVTSARRRLHVTSSDFDRHPHLLNVGNGVVDLRTGKLTPHDPDLLLTKLAGADYVEGARHRDVDTVLSCMADDVADSMQYFLGCATTGYPTDDVAVLDGSGANGKSVLLIAVQAALGDYATPVAAELLMQADGGASPAVWTAELLGVRLAYVEETREDTSLRLERLKAMTGGGRLTARRLYSHPITFDPTHTIVVATNHRPVVNTAEHAAWRRLRLVPFPHRYTASDDPGRREGDLLEDHGLRERVRGEVQRAATLSWLVDGAIYAFDKGRNQRPLTDWCETITARTAAWRGEEDVIGRFAAERVQLTGKDTDTVRGLDLFNAYRWWCEEERRPCGSAKNFYARWSAHDGVRDRAQEYDRDGRRWYRGLRLRPLSWADAP